MARGRTQYIVVFSLANSVIILYFVLSMYLKSLTLLGFKSFADKTTLNFLPGVTAIVGPNGCGKSNISDAIRWVLGEQSAKALRAGEMAEVIFNGTETRKPLAMAEVSLTIGDIDKQQLKAAGIELEFNEVTITRRVFRDGASEYFINKIPCRLRDIQQLFMGTGVGKASYSIIAQGNITQILSSKPEDRRLIFEEAAGITRYKSQKKEALKKLEYTDQNLLRVSDLIREVKRQIGSLQRQAGKARRYKQLSIELQHLETQYARHQYDVLNSGMASLSEKARGLEAEIEKLSLEVLQLEDEIARQRQELAEVEKNLAESNRRSLELKAEIERHQNRINYNTERIAELERQNQNAINEITQAEERRSAAQKELETLQTNIEKSQAALEEKRRILNERRSVLSQVEKELVDMQNNLRNAQSQSFGCAQQLSRLRNEIISIEARQQSNLTRLEKLHVEKSQIEQEQTQLKERLETFAQSVEQQKQEATNKRLSVEECQKRLQEIQVQARAITQELENLSRQQAGQRSRLSVLEQLEQAREGFSAAAAAVLRQSKNVLGSLADRIRVPDEYIVAVESALGANLQVILTEHPETAFQILDELTATKKGKASVAALNLRPAAEYIENHDSSVHPTANEENHATAHQNGKVHALSIIQADPTVSHILKGLLGKTYIVPDLKTAANALQNGLAGCDFVTLKGELLNRYGIFTGGYANGNGSASAPSSILGRKNQIAVLKDQLSKLQIQIDEARAKHTALTDEQKTINLALQDAQKQLRECEMTIAQREGEFKALQNALRLMMQRRENVDFEIESIQKDNAKAVERKNELSAKVSELERLEQEASQKIAALNTTIEEARQRRDAANTALTEAKVSLASEEQLFAAYCRQKDPLQTRIKELTQLAEQRKGEISRILERRQQYTIEIEESRQTIERLSHEREQANHQTTSLFELKSRLESEINERENRLKEARSTLANLQQQRNNIEIELTQKRMTIQNICERIYQKYQVRVEEVRSECITITIADQGQAKVETLTPEEMQARGLSTDWDAVANQITVLQKRIDEMGPVNLVAIEEYEETEQRYEFLTQQSDDLQKAKQQLLEVINKINSQTRDMFIETFNKIRENFQQIFVEVFGGGKADLRLIDEGDVLESGIEIVARPPGKQLQSISLLSGGEQAMTAISLLFSIYMVKPSPFCFLDELDAPLDESNINRFAKILQRFINNSQFIIITHNKRTISMADAVYGVTMQERGVSKVMSVKFRAFENNEIKAGSNNGESTSVNIDAQKTPQIPPTEEVVLTK
ncbi:MAG: chromosome segregation protein SMC [Verrucomicrobiae bacterium]|nr:chromosome segregation protein SMC [Verrucomicrobiae bacterium]